MCGISRYERMSESRGTRHVYELNSKMRQSILANTMSRSRTENNSWNVLISVLNSCHLCCIRLSHGLCLHSHQIAILYTLSSQLNFRSCQDQNRRYKGQCALLSDSARHQHLKNFRSHQQDENIKRNVAIMFRSVQCRISDGNYETSRSDSRDFAACD